MVALRTTRSMLAAVAGAGALALVLGACSTGGGGSADGKTLTLLVDNTDSDVVMVQGLVDDYIAKNPDVKIKVETRPAGADGDNIIKTRLGTGEMSDIFFYNSGSLFQALAPEKTLLDLTGSDAETNVEKTFQAVVSSNDKVYGVPVGTAMGGAIMYNKKVYADLGLTVPTTWKEYNANNDKIKAAGKTAIIQTYKDTWTSQLPVLGSFANVLSEDPKWADEYTANKAKYTGDEVASSGFEHLAEGFEKGYYNADFGSATYDDGLRMLATGEGVHYPMLTNAGATILSTYPDQAKDVGVFAIPGDDASKNALTTWFPSSFYSPKTTKNPDAVKKFFAFVASSAGCDSQTKSVGVTGPYLVKGCDLPADVPTYVSDMLPYFQKDGGTEPALEFLSPIKGPSLEQITVAVGSGITSAKDGAKQYDADVEKQAQQLGIKGW